MQFNSEDNNLDLISDIGFWTGASITDYTVKERTRNCNFGLDKVLGLILKADQRWEWDDTNNSDLPIGKTNLVSSQRDYGISGATYLKITKVVIKDANGEWHILAPIDKNSSEAKNLVEQRNSGTPKYYDLMGNSVWLEPCPNYNSTLGLRIFFQRNVSYFTYTDTTKEPGFAKPFHRLISLYASEDYLASKGLIGDRLKAIQMKIVQLETSLTDFYANRNPEDRPRLRFRKEDYCQRHLMRGGGTKSNQDQAIHW